MDRASPHTRLTRRAWIGGAAASLGGFALAGPAVADAPLRALRPLARPVAGGAVAGVARAGPAGAGVVATAGLRGEISFFLADMRGGTILDQGDGDRPMTPASVTKAITALYARATLGPGFRFSTRLIATGPVVDGVLAGDLVLAGGGDPALTTDHLAELAARARAAGLRRVTGAFRVWGGALPYVHAIDPGQLPHLGYNPAISGLNLNFNRVHFEWAPQGGRYVVTLDARSDTRRPPVTVARMAVADRAVPVYTYRDAGGFDDWTVARAALGKGGARWLPVRHPALYAGDVLRSLAAAEGIALGDPQETAAVPAGQVIAAHESDALDVLIRDMLEYSTNITAEVLGLTATRARGGNPAGLAESAAAMNAWARQALGASTAFGDHSGLGEGSRVSARELGVALVAAGADGALGRLMKPFALRGDDGSPLADPPGAVVAKTGTLNFVSTLAGYLRTRGGRELAFVILTRDPERRAAARDAQEEVPRGARDWLARSRRLQQQLLRHWAVAANG
jgi:D-alanyl-D-alanine carboxypeptidase/D-alanyl-D-alanine-endopeptidase (penicillin-binding protein 4)